MATKGVGASFKIDSSVDVLTDVSGYLNNIQASSQPQSLDGTVFQPNVANPVKTEVPGITTKSIKLTALHTKAAYAFFSAIEGLQAIDYEYGPEGTTTGETKITGVCNVLSVSMPQASVTGLETFDVDLSITAVPTISTY